MSLFKETEAKKWINGLIAAVAIVVGYSMTAFVRQLGDWFELEAKIPKFNWLSDGTGVVFGILSFLIIYKRRDAQQYLQEVFNELTKVIWSDRESTIKLTIGIIIGLIITAIIFGSIDFLVGKSFNYLYDIF